MEAFASASLIGRAAPSWLLASCRLNPSQGGSQTIFQHGLAILWLLKPWLLNIGFLRCRTFGRGLLALFGFLGKIQSIGLSTNWRTPPPDVPQQRLTLASTLQLLLFGQYLPFWTWEKAVGGEGVVLVVELFLKRVFGCLVIHAGGRTWKLTQDSIQLLRVGTFQNARSCIRNLD